MNTNRDLFLTALAPIIWGSTYYITTEFLPHGYPITVALIRALPAGMLLLLLVRQLPQPQMWIRLLILGALNFSLFWWLLFESAYRLPGGVAATLGAVQPLIVLGLARVWLGESIRVISVIGGAMGIIGIALLLLSPNAQFDAIGILAGLGGAVSMAAGTVLSRRWQPDVSALTFTSWQLIAGGLLLWPFAMWLEPSLPNITQRNLVGFILLGLLGAAISYALWFRGIAKLSPASVSTLGFLSPIVAVLLGWLLLDQFLTITQVTAIGIVLFSIWLSQQPHVNATLVSKFIWPTKHLIGVKFFSNQSIKH